MRLNVQSISLWLAVVFGAVMLAAFVAFPGFFPPMSPSMTPDEVARFYADNTGSIRLSMVTFNFCGVMLVPFFMVIVYQLKRIATPSQVFAYAFLAAAVSGVTLFALADLFWLIAAFRPDRDPQLIQLLNDLAWIIFTAPVGMIVAEMICLALAVYLDENAEPIFPRWVAPFSLAVAVAIIPSTCAAFVKSGPLAWDGAISFWLRICSYAAFLVVMFFVLRRVIQRQEAEEAAAAATVGEPVEVGA
jgi:hypothetical protein